jgi:hypothetical protein
MAPKALHAGNWPKGVSGNPGGRPAFSEISKAYRDALLKKHPRLKRRRVDLLVERILDEAIEGDEPVSAAREVADRAEGRAAQSVEATVSILGDEDRGAKLLELAKQLGFDIIPRIGS